MEIFKKLTKKGYEHYYEGTVEELDSMDKDNQHLHSEIRQVLMWFYEKHGLWIYCYLVAPFVADDDDYPKIVWVSKVQKYKKFDMFINTDNGLAVNHYHSPTEAYEAAIEYALNNLI